MLTKVIESLKKGKKQNNKSLIIETKDGLEKKNGNKYWYS